MHYLKNMRRMKCKIFCRKSLKIYIISLLVIIASFYSLALCQSNNDSEKFNRIRTIILAKQRGNISAKADPQYVTRGSIMHGGLERTYALMVPPNVAKESKMVPLVLVLHGGGGNASNAMRMSGFNEKALKEGFIVAYPQGTGQLKDILLTWNAGHCCGSAMKNKVDDVGFIGKLIDKLVQENHVDPKRVYVTGMSNGAMMTHRIGIELSDKVAAIAPIVGTLFGDEKRAASPVAAIIFNGMLDQSVPYAGGSHKGVFANSWDSVPPLPVESQASFWAKCNGCSKAPEIIETSSVKHFRYVCPKGKNVELYLLKDQGHAWPGGQPGSSHGNKPSQSLNATDVMWEFFKQQSK